MNVFDEFVLFAIAILCGGAVRLTLALVGQRWAQTFSNTVTYLVLPVVGLVIVQVISNSIALSLGMIGALSIVRFRHPVKSPLELVVYFLLLTVGIALTTRPYLAVALTAATIAIIVGVSLYQNFQRRRGNQVLATSPSDGDRRFMIEVSSEQEIESLGRSPFLVFSRDDRSSGRYSYKLAFDRRTDFDQQKDALASVEGVVSVSSFVS